jgi:hypothetical protein
LSALGIKLNDASTVPEPLNCTIAAATPGVEEVTKVVPATVGCTKGEKYTETVQLDPAPSEVGQLEFVKYAVEVMLMPLAGADPGLLRTNVIAALVVFTAVFGKFSWLTEVISAAPDCPVPVNPA